MILEGNQRASGAELARHLMNLRDNDHVSVHGLRGFVEDDLFGAFAEVEAISKATKCEKYLFSLSLNPPPDQSVSIDVLEQTIEQAEAQLGLSGHARAIVFHEKNGRRHAHVVWSRIQPDALKAVTMSHYKRKLFALSKELYRTHGWEMPDGFKRKEDRDPNTYDRTEGQQAKREKRDAAALKAMFQDCWARSDSRTAFEAALKENGFLLARGDRRGFVAVDGAGKIWSLSRWCGVKPGVMRARLGPEADLPSVDEVLAQARGERWSAETKAHAKPEPDPEQLRARSELVAEQRAERDALLQQQSERRVADLKARRPKGLRAILLKATGQYAKAVREAEAHAKRAQALDRREQQTLIDRHLAARRVLDRDAEQRGQATPLSEKLRTDHRQSLRKAADDIPHSLAEIERNPALVLAHVSKTKAEFTRTDVLRAIAAKVEDPARLQSLCDRAIGCRETVPLSSDGLPRYTTRAYRAETTKLDRSAQALKQARGFGVAQRHVDAAMTAQDRKMQAAFGGKLSEEQRDALTHILDDKGLACVVGLAGAGKSTMLTTAADAWSRDGVRVHGAALAGKAADGLQSASGIKSRTLASLEMSWANGNTPIDRGDVLVVDEAGMVGTRQMAQLTERMQGIGAKLVLVGDPEQLQPIEAGTPFKDMVAQHGAAELKDIHRQRAGWQKEASRDLAEGKTEKAVEAYQAQGAVTRTDEKAEAIEALVERYAMDTAADAQRDKGRPPKSRLALAYTRKDVHLLNQAIRGALRDEETRAQDQMIQTETGARAFGPGDRILFGRNDKDLGVKNGTLGTVKEASEGFFRVALDGDTPRELTVDPRRYIHLDHGYAVTVHKSQGATVDQAYVLGTRSMDKHLAYVAMTRHREDMQLYTSADDAPRWDARAQERSSNKKRNGSDRYNQGCNSNSQDQNTSRESGPRKRHGPRPGPSMG